MQIKIIQQCSNCGRENQYSEREWKSREETLCWHCGHTLSICSWFIGALKMEAEGKNGT